MINKKPLIAPMFLLSIGLLLVVLPLLINAFIKVPDFLRGLLMGIGLALEITAFVILKTGSTVNKSRPSNS